MTGLIVTKLTVPVIGHKIVNRAALFEKLDRGLDDNCRLILVCAPAGYGKTTLLAAWLEKRSLPVGWLSLEAADNDLSRFISYLVAALQTLKSGIGQSVQVLLQGPRLPAVENLLTLLVNDIDADKTPLVLVLDDYHEIHSTEIHEAVNFLLAHHPPHLHLVLSGRADPPIALAKLRASRCLVEIREADMRFSGLETADFLNQIMNLSLTWEMISSLEKRTEGWIAGLQLAAVSLQGHSDPGQFIEKFSGSHRYIMDYLIEEVLQREPAAVQDFLLQTAILDRLSASLCEAVLVSEQAGSGQMTLEYLEQSNLFILPLDENRQWYRYHRLFADILQQRLARRERTHIPELHYRASVWHDAHQDAHAAIKHAFASGKKDFAAGLVDKYAEGVMLRGEFTTLLNWLKNVPDSVVVGYPMLCTYQAYAMMMNGLPLEQIEARLDLAAKAPEAAHWGKVVLAYIDLLRGIYSQAREMALEALMFLPSEERFFRGIALFILSFLMMADEQFVTDLDFDHQLQQWTRETDNKFLEVVLQFVNAENAYKLGQLKKSYQLYQAAVDSARDSIGRPLPIAGRGTIRLGEIAREWNQLDIAEQLMLAGIELGNSMGQVGALGGHASLAHLYWETGRFKAAQEAIDKARVFARRFDLTDVDDYFVEMYQAWLWIVSGNLASAARWVEQHEADWAAAVKPDPLDEESRYITERVGKYELMIAARYWLAQSQPRKAIAALTEWIPRLQEMKRRILLIEAYLLRGLAFQQVDDQTTAVADMTAALRLAAADDFVRVFVDECMPVRELLAETLKHIDQEPELVQYIRSLLVLIPTAKEEHELGIAPMTTELSETLSRRETEVLEMLVLGLSTREIADRMVVSVHTVRSHLKSIYAKLGVHNRYAAVEKAREWARTL